MSRVNDDLQTAELHLLHTVSVQQVRVDLKHSLHMIDLGKGLGTFHKSNQTRWRYCVNTPIKGFSCLRLDTQRATL